MPYVQFTERHYIDGRLYEAGDRAWIGDNVGLSAGMVDLGAEAKALAPTPEEQKAGMDQVLAERKLADERAADEIAMSLATDRARTEAAAAEAKAADEAAASEAKADNVPADKAAADKAMADRAASDRTRAAAAAEAQRQHAAQDHQGGPGQVGQGQATLQPHPATGTTDPNKPSFIDHRADERGPQGVGTIQTKA